MATDTSRVAVVVDGKQVGEVDHSADDAFRAPAKFASINKMILRDLNDPSNMKGVAFWGKFKKEDIKRFLSNPERHEKQLRDVVTYLYGASSHFRRLIQYFVALSDLSYVVSPFKIDTTTANIKSVTRNYRRVLNLMSAINIKDQGAKILTVCMREDVFYGTIHETTDSCIIQQLPSEFCAISVVEDGVPNVSFDFRYFVTYPESLKLYPPEFAEKYELYKTNQRLYRWQELSAPNSFAIKVNKDMLEFAMPPLAGILRELYDIEDYKEMKKTKTNIENYAMVVMQLGVDAEGNWTMDYNKAKGFYKNLDAVLPEEIGSVLSPMPINKISFERTHTGDTDTVAEAEQNLFSAAGVSSLLFNNPKASSNALLLSIKADQAITYGVVKSIESAINRFIRRHNFGKYFKVTFLDCSPFNRKEVSDGYLKAAQYGMPTVSYYLAANGIAQDEMDGLNFLEDQVLDVKSRFRPLQSSSTQSANSVDNEAGRRLADIDELSDNGEVARERDEE